MHLLHRRAMLGSMATGFTAVIAGCLGGEENGEDCPSLPEEPAYEGWFRNVSNYQRTCDLRAEPETTVRTGTWANDAYWGFSPPAIAISPGTPVTWEWTGRGGPHNVVEQNRVFDSGRAVSAEHTTFNYTFDTPGIFKYDCRPHANAGMKGAVFVSLD